MVEGTITTWKVAEGAQVSKGDVLMEYENEKNVIEYEALESGLIHLVAQEGDTVAVGEVIAVLAADQAEYNAIAGGAASAAPAVPAAAPVASGEGVTEIQMPRAGLTMVEGTISEWKVAEGAQVAKGDVVMEFENEKNSIEYEIVHGGFLHILAPVGETVAVGKTIAYVTDTKAQYDALVNGGAAPAAEVEKGCARECPTCVHTSAAPAAPAVSAAGGRIRATGLAKKLAREAGINLADVQPSGGPDGQRIVAKDVENYLKAPKPAAAPAPVAAAAAVEDEVKEIPWTGIRKTIANNMYNSLQKMAQSTCVCEVDATELLALRAKLVEDQEYLGYKATVNDLLCKMLGKVMAKHPLANATFDGKTLYSHKHVHLSVAVGAEDGLMVPVVKNIDTLSLGEISAKIKDLATRAKERRLQPDEQSGGTFTITNVGMFPIDIGTPVINPPQVAICGFGRTVLKPAVMPDGSFQARSMMNVFLTFDHQIIDGLEVGRIFNDIQYYIEHPEMILA